MAGYECFDVSIEDHIAHLVLKRGDQLNTMTPAFWRELPEIVDDLDARAAARVVVISSTGKHFSAGMDLSVFSGDSELLPSGGVEEVGRQRARLFQTVMHLQESFSVLERVRMPVIAAIQGGCVGGAVDMVTACDLRYATEGAFFTIQEIKLGMTADVGTLQRLPKLIPEGVARELAYTGDRLPAARAKELGLVSEVYPSHEAMLEGVMGVARRIAARSPLAIWGTKEMIGYARDHSVADSLRHIAAWQSGMFQPHDMLEEMTAKGEGRDPRFEELPPRPGG